MIVAVRVVMTMIMVMTMAVRLIMVMAMAVRVIMAMIMPMGVIVLMLRFRFPGFTYSYRIASVSASTGITHSYSFCSTNKDFTCISVPRISLMPAFLHSGQWLNIPSGL